MTIAAAMPLAAADSITTDQQAQEATTAALADLKAGDNDPAKTVAAALEFTQLVDYYKEKGNTDQVCEMQAYVYWCKKRMNLESLQAYVAAKGAPAQALATRAEEIVSAEVPKDQADVYLDRAEAYAKANPKNYLAIAVRYFEVADRFTGAPVSLKAQRASLEAMQKAAVVPSGGGESLGRDFQIPTVTAADMPEAAQKALAISDQQVSVITSKAAGDLGKERSKAIEVLLKEAEAAQKKGNLEAMLAHQLQAKDLEHDQKGLSTDATRAVDAYRKTKRTVIGKASIDVIAERKKMARQLLSIQTDETKKGNTAGAVAIKNACDKLSKELEEAGASALAGMKEPDRPFVIKPEGGIPLTKLVPTAQEGQWNVLVVDEKSSVKTVVIDGVKCVDYIMAHAPSSNSFKIPPGAKQFTAYGMSVSSQSVKFIVNIDGKPVFTSKMPDAYPGSRAPINVMIPDGAKKIELIVDPCGDNNADHSLWAYPYFSK